MRIVSNKQVGVGGAGDAFGALEQSETKEFIADLLVVCRKHGKALVPQNQAYQVDFHDPMRVIPLDMEIEAEIQRSWVCFEE